MGNQRRLFVQVPNSVWGRIDATVRTQLASAVMQLARRNSTTELGYRVCVESHDSTDDLIGEVPVDGYTACGHGGAVCRLFVPGKVCSPTISERGPMAGHIVLCTMQLKNKELAWFHMASTTVNNRNPD